MHRRRERRPTARNPKSRAAVANAINTIRTTIATGADAEPQAGSNGTERRDAHDKVRDSADRRPRDSVHRPRLGAGGGGGSGGSGGGGAGGSAGASGGAVSGAGSQGSAATSGSTATSGTANSSNPADAARGTTTLGTNGAGTAQSGGGSGPKGSTTVGRPGNLAGGTSSGRIDGTTTPGPSLQGDDRIRSENAPNSSVDRTVKSICKGC